MAQFARPDSDVTNTGTGGFGDIDEVTPSDADFWWGANNVAEELEVGLGNVTDPQSSSSHTFRYRIAKTNNGVVDGGGNAVTVTARLMQGATQIATDTAKTADGTWTQYAYTLTAGEADAITDYADLRLEFVTSTSGGAPAARRGGAVSWAELEVPDVSAGQNYDETGRQVAIAATIDKVDALTFGELARLVAIAATISRVDALTARTAVAEVALSNPSGNPGAGADVVLVRARKANGSDAGLLRVWLMAGAVQLDTWDITLADSFATDEHVTTDITAYADLRLRFQGVAATDQTLTVQIARAYLKAPESTGNVYDESGRELVVAVTITASDALNVSDALSVEIAATISRSDIAALGEPVEVVVASALTTSDAWTTNETDRLVAGFATVAASDRADLTNTASLLIAATLDVLDEQGGAFNETGRQVAIAATVAASDRVDLVEALTFTASSALDATDDLHFAYDETGRALTISATISASDLWVLHPQAAINATITASDRADMLEGRDLVGYVSVTMSATFTPSTSGIWPVTNAGKWLVAAGTGWPQSTTAEEWPVSSTD